MFYIKLEFLFSIFNCNQKGLEFISVLVEVLFTFLLAFIVKFVSSLHSPQDKSENEVNETRGWCLFRLVYQKLQNGLVIVIMEGLILEGYN